MGLVAGRGMLRTTGDAGNEGLKYCSVGLSHSSLALLADELLRRGRLKAFRLNDDESFGILSFVGDAEVGPPSGQFDGYGS